MATLDARGRAVALMERTRDSEMTWWLTTGRCARVLGVTSAFIRGEIEDRRLTASVIERPHGRSLIRVSTDDFRVYLAQFAPHALPVLERDLAL